MNNKMNRILYNNYQIRSLLPDANLVGFWKFDEGTGTIVYDSAPITTAHPAAINGSFVPTAKTIPLNCTCPSWITGKFGNALRFNNGATGVNASCPDSDVVIFADSASLNFVDKFTIAMWIYPEQNNGSSGVGEYCFLTKRSYNANGFRLRMVIGGRISFITYTGTSPYAYDLQSTSAIPLNQWTFVCASIDGTNKNLYVGTPPSSLIKVTTSPINFINNTSVYMSTNSSSCGAGFVGGEDHLRVYNIDLTDTEVNTLYTEGGVCLAPNPNFTVS